MLHQPANLILTAGLLSLVPRLSRIRSALAATTLLTAWNWGGAAVAVWGLAWSLDLIGLTPPGVADQLWYWASLLALCSAVAVLGAKRPGARVWGWFVLVPLLLVLGWPAAFAWRGEWLPERLILLEPACVAYVFVCLMGFGNYLGTRYWLSAMLLAWGLLWLLAPIAAFHWSWVPSARVCRMAATACLVAAAWLPAWPRSQAGAGVEHPLDRAWRDFRDAFGLVWARRIQDRFNAAAAAAAWPARLEFDGLHWRDNSDPGDNSLTNSGEPPPAARQAAEPAMERTLRWLWRRFVDPEWINRRLGHDALPENDGPPGE